MSDWDYVVGETVITRGFQIFEKKPKQAFDGTGATAATITILKSDLTAATPAVTDEVMGIDTTNPLRLTYALTTLNMPQTKGSYRFIITITITGTTIKKTFEGDLEVFRG